MSKLFFIPVYFNKDLALALISINQLGEFIDVDLKIVSEQEIKYPLEKYRYWNKLSFYQQEKNIFRSMPLRLLILIVILFLKCCLQICKSAKVTKVSPETKLD